MMQEVFEKLKTLQDILSKKFEVEHELNNIPKALITKTELLNRLKKSYIEKNDQYEQTKKRIAGLKQKMAEAEAERENYEKQMDLIKTQREYEALDKEIKDATEKEQQLRKDLQKEEKMLEDMQKNLEREETMIKQQETELNAENEKIKSEGDAKRELLNELRTEEAKIIPGLDEEILFKFERIIRSKSGLGIVPVYGGVCTGCHMILPGQFVNDVRSSQGILFCPYCSRILFYQEAGENENMLFPDVDAGSLADLVDYDSEDYDAEEEEDEEEQEYDSEEE